MHPAGSDIVIGSIQAAGLDQFIYHGDGSNTSPLTALYINWATGNSSQIGISNVLYSVHGSLMLISWGFILPLGAIFARYLKAYPDALWFKLHRSFQPSGYLISLIALIIAFVMVSSHFAVSHGIVGLTVMCLGFVQVGLAFIRPHKEPGQDPSTVRKMWEYSHWWIGRFALLLAVVTIYLGLVRISVYDPTFTVPGIVIYTIWIGVLSIGVVVREVYQCLQPVPTLEPVFKIYMTPMGRSCEC